MTRKTYTEFEMMDIKNLTLKNLNKSLESLKKYLKNIKKCLDANKRYVAFFLKPKNTVVKQGFCNSN